MKILLVINELCEKLPKLFENMEDDGLEAAAFVRDENDYYLNSFQEKSSPLIITLSQP